jgi:hypothetical protein
MLTQAMHGKIVRIPMILGNRRNPQHSAERSSLGYDQGALLRDPGISIL